MDDDAIREIKNRQRKRAIKVAISEGLIFVAVVFLVVATTFVTIGYNINPSDGKVERAGLLQIQSMPTGANINIDGESIFGWTNLSRSVSEGDHEIILSKEGYESWTKKVSVSAGLYYRLNYARLFLKDYSFEKIANLSGDEKISFAKDGNIALIYSSSDFLWKILEINGEKIKSRNVDLSSLINSSGLEAGVNIRLQILAWNGDNDKVLIKINNDFVLINIENIDESINLSKHFGVDFSDIKIVNDSATELFVIIDGCLKEINLNNDKISGVLVRNIKSFYNLKSDLIYSADENEDGVFEVGFYQNGNKKGHTITVADKKIDEKNEDSNSAVKSEQIKFVTLSEYYGDYYISLVLDTNEKKVWQVLKAESLEKIKNNDFEVISNMELETLPTKVEIGGGGELIVSNFEDKLMIYDVETGKSIDNLEISRLDWLDEHMFYKITNEGLVVMDFDGKNQHKFGGEFLRDSEVKISKNNRWIYLVSEDNILTRVRILE